MAVVVIEALHLACCDEAIAAGAPHCYEPVDPGPPKLIECDVAVYGGTPAGVTTAIQAARNRKKAVLLSSHRHIGGMTSGGFTAMDLGRKDSIGGLALEFYNRIGKARDDRPSEAESRSRNLANKTPVATPGASDAAARTARTHFSGPRQLSIGADVLPGKRPSGSGNAARASECVGT